MPMIGSSRRSSQEVQAEPGAMIETAYLHLSRFQDGVGEAPIDLTQPADVDPGTVAEILGPLLERSKRQDETQALAAEFAEFKRQA